MSKSLEEMYRDLDDADRAGNERLATAIAARIKAAKSGEMAEPKGPTAAGRPAAYQSRMLDEAGKAARYTVEGVMSIPNIFAEPLAYLMNVGARALGAGEFPSQNQAVSDALTSAGLPQPEGALERGVADVSRALAATGGGVGIAERVARTGGEVASTVGRKLAEMPGTQAAAATAGSGAASFADEVGAGPGVQAGVGLGASVLAPTTGAAAWRAVRGGQAVAEGFSAQGQQNIVSRALQGRASDPRQAATNIRNAGETLTEQTTGPLSRDAGLLRVEQQLRRTDPDGLFAERLSAQNAERQRVLNVLLDNFDEDLAKAARAEVTTPMREQALQGPYTPSQIAAMPRPESVTRAINSAIQRLKDSPDGARRQVQAAIKYFESQLDGVSDPAVLYAIRKDLNAAIQGKLEGDKAEPFKNAGVALIPLKEAIDNQIERAAPGYKEYMQKFAELSREIERKAAIRDASRRVATTGDPIRQEEILSPGMFRRAVAALEDEGLLSDEQVSVMRAIADDIELAQAPNAPTVRTAGSDTFQNMTMANVVGRMIGGDDVTGIGRVLTKPIEWLMKIPEDDVQRLLYDAMLDPDAAAALLARPSPQAAQRLSKTMADMGGAAAYASIMREASNRDD